ncbi:hypothetical protein V3914_000467 [Escherichia coli]|nr:hypothetical protein [Escherichia coli]EJQ5578785.1 hypothetical protein [Escherichia coli]
MESNIKGLVSTGHEMASELKAECGAVDMRSVAKLISDLATQLEVQLVRANALAAENAALKQSEKEFNNFCRQEFYDWEDDFTETPATDAFLAELRAKAFDDLCAAFVKHASVSGLDDGDSITVKEATDALLHCAAQLREGEIK